MENAQKFTELLQFVYEEKRMVLKKFGGKIELSMRNDLELVYACVFVANALFMCYLQTDRI